MPFGFPSHQGLIAPLWRRWPDSFGVLGLWVGAIVPDLIDGVASVIAHGHPGQWMAHSIIGLFVLCVPIGVPLTWSLRRTSRASGSILGDGAIRKRVRWVGAWLTKVDNVPSVRVEALSVWVGALSHVVFDLFTHEHSKLLWPWRDEDPAWFGTGWTATWFRVSPPGYADYSIGPHFVAWTILSILGAVMFFRYPPRTK
jgi:Domain of unknown function (DUF4184)